MQSPAMTPHGERSSRRALLAGSLGALGALIAHAAAQPIATAAASDPVLLNTANTATGTTSVTTPSGVGLHGSTSGSGNGIFGQNTGTGMGAGVSATSRNGPAFSGTSSDGAGLVAQSTTSWGVFASTRSGTKAAIAGHSIGLYTGVYGFCGNTANTPRSPDQTAVYGLIQAGNSIYARGVTGETTFGRGVNGVATGGTGVYGSATDGEGVHGESSGSNGVTGSTSSGAASGVFGQNTSTGYGVAGTCHGGVGVSGFSNNGIAVVARSDNGIAIQAVGRLVFSTSGLAPVASGKRSAVVTPGIDLTVQSKILTTLESNQPGLSIERVIKSASADQFTVVLTGPVAVEKSANVAWFVIG